MNKKESLELTIAALKSLRTRTHGIFGICSYFSMCDLIYLDSDMLTPYFESWDKFSGNVEYPVPSTSTSAERAYKTGDRYNMWNKDTQYGSDRHELLEHCITEATRELTEFLITDK